MPANVPAPGPERDPRADWKDTFDDGMRETLERMKPVMVEFFDADQQPCGGAIHDMSSSGGLAIVPENARFWRPVR